MDTRLNTRAPAGFVCPRQEKCRNNVVPGVNSEAFFVPPSVCSSFFVDVFCFLRGGFLSENRSRVFDGRTEIRKWCTARAKKAKESTKNKVQRLKWRVSPADAPFQNLGLDILIFLFRILQSLFLNPEGDAIRCERTSRGGRAGGSWIVHGEANAEQTRKRERGGRTWQTRRRTERER